jgi:hypothetical protein
VSLDDYFDPYDLGDPDEEEMMSANKPKRPKKLSLSEDDVRRIAREAAREVVSSAVVVRQSGPGPLRMGELLPGEPFQYVNRYTGNVYVKLRDGHCICVRSDNNDEGVVYPGSTNSLVERFQL